MRERLDWLLESSGNQVFYKEKAFEGLLGQSKNITGINMEQ